MEAKIHMGCLIFFIIQSQVIGDSSEENNEDSLKFHIRKKRLFDKSPHGNRPVPILLVPYIVNIHKNGKVECAGSILTPHVIITAAHCVDDNDATYTILVDSQFRNRGMLHHCTKIIPHPKYDAFNLENDLALSVVFPPIDIEHSHNREITLHNGDLPPGTPATFSGWGCTHFTNSSIMFPCELRSIIVPIISHEDCRIAYDHMFDISERDVCTFDRNKQKGGGFGDSGGPLAVDEQLVGVMSWSKSWSLPVYPDVFVNLAYPLYKNWILANMYHVAF